MPDQIFIPGIYNYCDRWCEKCPFTARCENYKELKDAGLLDDVDLNNPKFWESLAAVFTDTVQLLHSTAKDKDIDLKDIRIDEETIKNKEQKSKNHPLILMSRGYSENLETFFEKWEQQILSLLESMNDDGKSGRIIDSIDVARWYQHFIPAKLSRAVSSNLNLSTRNDYSEINDILGFAKVSLVSIDRSMAALTQLCNDLPYLLDDVISLLNYLEKLKRRIKYFFPKASQFIRPGLDE